MRLSPSFALLMALCVNAAVFAQSPDYPAEKNWVQVCEESKAQPIEELMHSSPLVPDKLASCDESALYYGFDGKPDYPAALQCGWNQRAHPQPSNANMFYGPGVLTMLYANGLAVERNYDLATHFACEEQWASEAEMALRIGHLEYLRHHATGAKFDLCDDITSGLSMGFCTSIDTRRADVNRAQEISAIVTKLPDGARAAFSRLQSAESAFEDSRSGLEVDLSGTARGMFELQEQKKLRDQFLINLQRFGSADIPPATTSDLAALDRQLNVTYRQIQEAPPSTWRYGTIKPEGIRDTERTWIALTDAWLDFARAAYPTLSATSVHAQLIRLRLHQLRSLAPATN